MSFTIKSSLILGCLCALALCGSRANADHIWINEFHYDNPSTDVGEFIEIAIRNPNGSGFSASDYAIELINGSNGSLYATSVTLNNASTITPNIPIVGSTSTITLYSLNLTDLNAGSGIQNGAPDGIALVNVTNSTVESFLSYEGTFASAGGISTGANSIDVGAAEPGTGNLSSISAMGLGIGADQFGASSFALTEAQTPGQINTGQTFGVPEPASIALMLGCFGVMVIRRR